jgi:hypothetical protein
MKLGNSVLSFVYPIGALTGAFSSGLGWRLYFRFVSLPPCMPLSGTSVGVDGLSATLTVSLAASKAGEPIAWSYDTPR